MVNSLYNKIRHNIIEKTNPYIGGLRRKIDGVAPDFAIISNNCWAGSVYRWYNLPYLTPTAGLYFFADDYIRFLSNLKYYMSLPPERIPLSESKYKKILIERKQDSVPLGIIDDIEIVFLHYPTFEEAKDKWVRRAARVNWNNLIVKNSEMNYCSREHIMEFDRLPFDKKFIFTTRDYGIESQIIFKEYMGKDQVKDDTTIFNKYVDITKMIKNQPFKK
jgi:uncharacterized protein (DUF1919 family)